MARDFGRWFRFYDAVLDDPKVQRLSDPLFRAWVNLMCLANRGAGAFSDDIAEIAFALRVTEAVAIKHIDGLLKAGLIEHIDERFEPHNWNERQFKSDVSTDRVKRFRQRSAKRSETVSETPPEAETDTEAEQKQSRADGERASAPPTRKPWPPDAVVPEKWLKLAGDELQRLGRPQVDLPLVAAKFQAHYGGEGQARTMTEWQGQWTKFVLNEYRGKSNGSGQHGRTVGGTLDSIASEIAELECLQRDGRA